MSGWLAWLFLASLWALLLYSFAVPTPVYYCI